MRMIGAAVNLLWCVSRLGQEIAAAPQGGDGVARTIERGLAFLQSDAAAWKADHDCVSCHHAALVIWSMQEARQGGFAIEEPRRVELAKWIAESGDGKSSLERPAAAPKALNTKALYFVSVAKGVWRDVPPGVELPPPRFSRPPSAPPPRRSAPTPEVSTDTISHWRWAPSPTPTRGGKTLSRSSWAR